jgi:hypothetical protein
LILAAGSKSAFFGVLAGLACFAALAAATAVRRRSEGSARPAMRRLAFVLAVAVLAFGAGVLAVRSGVIGRVRSTRTIERLARTGSNLNERIDTRWRLAWDCLAAYPLTGVGIGAYIIESSNFAAADGIPMAGPPDSAENYFLQAASELGLPGLAVFVWFLWEIVRKAQSAWGGTSARSRDRWLLAGAISGTVAYGFNIMAHSYIGSFEIKYAFWLLVAAIFSRRKMTAGAALAIFGAVFLWSSARSLSLAQTTKRYPIPGEVGLGKVEKTDDGREFRWSREYGGFPFRVETGTLVLPIHASHPDIAAHPLPGRFSLASDVFSRGRTLKELTLSSPDWLDVEMDLPAQDVGLLRFLLIEVGRTWNPSKMTGAPDSRNLGVALGPVRFR